MDNDSIQYDGYIAYRRLFGKRASIVFFGGFASNMDGTKATAIYKFCSENDIALVIFDYSGHGRSNGHFTDYVISDWYNDCIKVITRLTQGKQIIIGSSMGGWLMLLAALQFPEIVGALLGISSAPDFTEDLIHRQLSDKHKEELNTKGVINLSYENHIYEITKNLIIDGQKHLLLNKESMDINCPVRLLHGMDDKDVHYQISLKLAKKIQSSDLEVNLLKSASHNMSDPRTLKILFRTIEELVNQLNSET